MNQLPELPERDLPPGRHRLLKEHLMTEIRRIDTAPAHAPAPARNTWLRPAIAAAAVASAASAAFALLPSPGGDASAHPPSRATVALLEDVALAAEHADVPKGIRDDQFVYIRSRGAYTVQVGNGPVKLEPVHDREIWKSVDGTRWGLLEEARDGNEHQKLKPDTPGNERATDYRALSGLPTDPAEMRDWLYRVSSHQVDDERPDRDAAAFTLFGDLIGESMMPPRVSAALYRAAAKIPGVEFVPHVKDAVGRAGVAVTRKAGNEREELIFDEKTHVYLGERDLDADGTLKGGDAVIERAVVDRAGQRP
ncbi:CU044_5270 family protein [Streptomyces sp. NPDC048045]|uniref:CU044_5270 family protein n=1 Tax=Streptomyces sp. NPDC048045 TaxID=3154710 RepID=UPI00341CC4F2